MPSLSVFCVQGIPCTGSMRVFVLSGTVHVPLWYLLKLCLGHSTVQMWVHYTSGTASYKALQKGSFKKPWYCLTYNPKFPILQTSCVEYVCSANSTHCTVALVLQIPYLLSSFSASFLPPCLPLISGECSIVVLSLLVIWFSCYFTMMNLVIAFFYCRCVTLYCMCRGCMVR